MFGIVRKAAKNKVVWYVLTRYLTYFLQFVVSLLCAAKMGPYCFGIWGFMLLLLNYMQWINFGIPNSANILLVQERNNPQKFAEIESTAFWAQACLCIGVLIFALGNVIFGYGFMDKYDIGWLFYLVCVTAMLVYMIQICMTVYRVKHQLLEIAIYQSSIPLLTFIALFLATGRELLLWFSLAYLIGNAVSFFIFIVRGKLCLKARPTMESFKRIMSKGLYLFVYNGCFYFIVISTRTVVSSYYQVEDFGYFTFAYTLADAVILLLSAITFLLFPKAIEKLHTNDVTQVKHTISLLRVNYITLTHGLMYVTFLLFPIITWLIPKYLPALPVIYLVALALLSNTMSFGYTDYLMAQSKDRQIASISLISFVVNVILAVFLAGVMHCSFEYVIIATIISYWLFSILSVVNGKRQMGDKYSFLIVAQECFPLRLMVPFLASGLIIAFRSMWLLPIPLVLYLTLNINPIKEIIESFRRLLSNPDILDVKGV